MGLALPRLVGFKSRHHPGEAEIGYGEKFPHGKGGETFKEVTERRFGVPTPGIIKNCADVALEDGI